jgi:hypothetical protein
VLGFLGIWSYNPNENEACLGSLVEYQGREYCLNTPQDSLTYLEHMICDTMSYVPIRNVYEISELENAIAKFQKELINEENGLGESGMSGIGLTSFRIRSYLDTLVAELNMKKELIKYSISSSTALIRKFSLDSTSFYRNVGKAFWNPGAYHYNA